MRKVPRFLLDCVLSNFRSRAALQLELIVLRHQLEVLRRTRTARVRLTRLDRMFWHPKPPSQTWRTFLRNHVGCLALVALMP